MSQADLEKNAKNGVVAIFVQPATGQGVWVKLDGSLVDETTLSSLMTLEKNTGATNVLYGSEETFAQKTVVSFLNNPNTTLRADSPASGEAPNIVTNAGDKYQASHLPNALVVESKSDLWLAREHVFAKVEINQNDMYKADVVRLDGMRMGQLDISVTEKPSLAGKSRAEKRDLQAKWESENESNMIEQVGALSGGAFFFKPREESETFKYPTYCPRIPNAVQVMGYIYSMKYFFDSRSIQSSDE
jgi:hypothetical protein